MRHAHSLYCLCSLFVSSLTDQAIFSPRPVLHVTPTCPRAGLRVTLQTRKPYESPLIPTPHRTVNTVPLAKGFVAVARPAYAFLHFSMRELRLINSSARVDSPACGEIKSVSDCLMDINKLNLVKISPTPGPFLVNAIDHQGLITITNVVLIH